MTSLIKKQFPTPQQKQLLLHLIEADSELRIGKFSSSFTKKESELRWKKIAEQLNALNGANKSWESWRKTWQDRKSNTKKKFSNARRQSNMTGGGPPPKPPNEEDMIVLSTMPAASLIGHSDCQESVVELVDINMQSNSVGAVTDYYVPSPSVDVPYNTEMVNEKSIEVVAPEPQLGTTAQPTKGIRRRLMSRHQTMKQSLHAAENLNKTLEAKNRYKKVFYEQYIQLMQQQTEALVMIANTIGARNSPYI